MLLLPLVLVLVVFLLLLVPVLLFDLYHGICPVAVVSAALRVTL